ncbi:MAG: hypothetical protein ACRD1R_04465 [Acidobacteriota bacterium]
MKFTMHLTDVNGEQIEITWEDGVLSGDEIGILILENEARLLEGQWYGLGPANIDDSQFDHLKNPHSTVKLAMTHFQSLDKITGDVPENAWQKFIKTEEYRQRVEDGVDF